MEKCTISLNSQGGSSQIYGRLFYCGLKKNQLRGATLLATLDFGPFYLCLVKMVKIEMINQVCRAQFQEADTEAITYAYV